MVPILALGRYHTLISVSLSQFAPLRSASGHRRTPFSYGFTMASSQMPFWLGSLLCFGDKFYRERTETTWLHLTRKCWALIRRDELWSPEVYVTPTQAHLLWQRIGCSLRKQVHYCALSKKVYTHSICITVNFQPLWALTGCYESFFKVSSECPHLFKSPCQC